MITELVVLRDRQLYLLAAKRGVAVAGTIDIIMIPACLTGSEVMCDRCQRWITSLDILMPVRWMWR